MGLDQYAAVGDSNYQWRKHPQLHEYMEKIWRARGGKGEFNCVELQLTQSDIKGLVEAIENNNLPKGEAGFFFGNEFQDHTTKIYREQDLEFCKKALEAFSTDPETKVTYDSWW